MDEQINECVPCHSIPKYNLPVKDVFVPKIEWIHGFIQKYDIWYKNNVTIASETNLVSATIVQKI
jgi:hypothetical protein